MFRTPCIAAIALPVLIACSAGEPGPAPAPVLAAASGASAAPLPPAAGIAAGEKGMVLRVAAGGSKPDHFCIPEWSIRNETGEDVGALLVELRWLGPDGAVLDAGGEFGSLIEPFPAGGGKDLSLNGYPTACTGLRLVVGTYACRDADAVRRPCPGPLRAVAAGGVQVDLGGAVEGSMRGAVEPR